LWISKSAQSHFERPKVLRRISLTVLLCAIFTGALGCRSGSESETSIELLNVSYDPTRELYEEYNKHFAKKWQDKTGHVVNISQSHGGSGKQSRSVIDGLPADVVTLALGYDIDAIAENTDLLSNNWQAKFPHNSTPFTSIIVFVVRAGNPKEIRSWADLIKPEVKVITANPKTSGAARWSYLAAWAYGLRKLGGSDQAKHFITELYQHVPILDTGARGATITFAKRGIGDVLVTWESEALMMKRESGGDALEVVYPELSILAETPVALVEKNVRKRGTEEVATAYLLGLFDEDAQQLAAKHGYRPVSAEILNKNVDKFPAFDLVSLAELGSWKDLQQIHFSDGGIFDQAYQTQTVPQK